MEATCQQRPSRCAVTTPEVPRAKAQPWKAFINDPEIKPFAADQSDNGVLRLKTEKDEHGLGG
jgi:hypothetical protein